MGPSKRNGRSIFPRSEGTNRSGHTTSGIRTSIVASLAGRTHHNQYVLRHNCEQTSCSLDFRQLHPVPPTPALRARMPHALPCLCKRFVCACLPYFLCLNRVELSDFCVRSARWACTRASKLVHACALCDIQRGTRASQHVGACIFLLCNI